MGLCFCVKPCIKFFLKIEKNFAKWSHHHLERHSLQVRHKQDWGQKFILLLPQAAVLPVSDAGSDGIEPASSFVI